MEIEVGEYARTNKGNIFIYALDSNNKADYILERVKNIGNKGYTWRKKWLINEEIVKHSRNIIDLIEVGDIVECFVEEDVDGEDTIKYEVVAIDILDTNGNKINEIGICGEDGVEFIPFKNIRSILTHEQYKQNCYRLEE